MIARRLRTDLAASIGFFTRLPVGLLMPGDAKVGTLTPAGARIDMARAVWAFPVAGATAGLAGGGVFALCARAGMTPLLAAAWSLAALLLFTGALHEDGLADVTDGFGGGRDAGRKLAIMRDSQIGSYGALALLVSSLIRIAAVTAMGKPANVCAAMVVCGAMSRAAIVLLLVALPPARPDGVAASLHPIARLPALAACGIAVALDASLLRGWTILAVPSAALLTTLALARLSRRQIGGHTGDVLGACAVLAECVTLTACSLFG